MIGMIGASKLIANPFYLLFLATFSQMVILLGHIWRAPIDLTIKPKKKWGWERGFDLFYAFLAWYIGITVSVGYLEPVSAKRYLMPIILGIIIGTGYLLKAAVLAPTSKTLIIHGIIIAYEILAVLVLIPPSYSYLGILWIFLPLVLIPLEFIPTSEKEAIWDWRAKLKFLYSWQYDLILFVLVVIEGLLQFRGYSLIPL